MSMCLKLKRERKLGNLWKLVDNIFIFRCDEKGIFFY